ncbi:late histone H2B.L4-like [Belonocnema kinseyi]|uniref:late histone H2B.L4-like n=1 Tax=Belonocnema kinseyi TaxID=2817044 RepID=UPI00143D624E|nr:late histone H2B.L4-like [Belonocnema kinseyi]
MRSTRATRKAEKSKEMEKKKRRGKREKGQKKKVEEKKNQVEKKRKEKDPEKKNLRERKKITSEKIVLLKGENYTYYLKKILKMLHPDTTISREALNDVNDLMNDIFHRITSEASRFTKDENCCTIVHGKIEMAVKNLFSGLLKKHAIIEGTKAIMKYNRELRK